MTTSVPILIVTPTLGTSSFLEETLESLRYLPQDTRCRHVIACPLARVAELSMRHKDAHIVAETGKSMYGAINDAAASDSQWQWLTYINDDDYFLPGIEQLLRRLCQEEAAEPTIVYTRVLFVKHDRSPICEFPIARDSDRLLDYYRIACNPIATHGSFINRAAFEQLGGFDASFRYVGDMDFFVRALQHGVRFRHAAIWTAAFRLHGENLTAHREQFAREENRVRSTIEGTVGRLTARMLRSAFVVHNTRSYLQRLVTIRRLRVNDYLTQLERRLS